MLTKFEPLIVMSSITSEVKPAISVVVAPNVNVDEPKVVVGFAKFAFEIPALPDKFEFVNVVALNFNIVICNNGVHS